MRACQSQTADEMWSDGARVTVKRVTARGAAGFVTTFCRISAGGDELFWHWGSSTRCQFGRGGFAAGGGGDGDRIEKIVNPRRI